MVVVKFVPFSKKAIITLSFLYDADSQTMKNPQCSNRKMYQSLVLLSLVQYLDFKMNGSLNDALKSKFANVSVQSHNGSSILTIITEPNFSAVRKVLSLVSKHFQVSKCYPLVKKYLSSLKVSNSNEINWCMDELSKALKKAEVYVTGSVKVPDGKLKELDVEFSVESFSDKKEPAKSEAISAGYKCKNALESFFAQLLFKSFMIETTIQDYHVIPFVNAKIEKERYVRFAEKLVKLGDKLEGVLALEAATSGLFTVDELSSLKKMTQGDIVKLYEKIEKTLI